MLQLVRYTSILTPNGYVSQGEPEVIGTVPGNPEEQIRITAEVLFPLVFTPEGKLREIPKEWLNK